MADRARWKYGSLLIEGHVSMACSPGVIPDQGRMIQPQGTTQPTSAIADLILEWGNTGTWAEVRRWQNCSIVRLEQTHEPYKDTVYTIQDRRWRWKHKFVNGSYNVKDETGTAIGSTLKNAREIATLLLNALGETGYDVTAIPTTASVAPEVHWIYASAADELNKLCGLFGAQVHLRAANTIKLVVNGVGTIPPSTNLIEPVAAGIAFEQPPEKIRAYGSETLFDSWLMLEAVCPEFGGSTAVDSDVKLVDNLSFKPAAGWGNVDPERFLEVVGANDVETKKLRAHCEKFMWRMFRIKGFAGLVTKPPGYDAETDPETGSPYPAVTNMKLLLPLHPTRLQAGIDETGKYVRNPAELAGSFRSADYLGAENLPKYALWKFGFRMDVNNGYVVVLLVAMGLGLIHGLLVTKVKLQPFVVTLCSLLIYRGVSRWLTNDNPAGFGELQEVLGPVASGRVGLLFRGQEMVFGIPIPFFLLTAIGVVSSVFLGRTIWGRYLLALGRNEEAARFSGINTGRITLMAYVICTVLAALGGMLFALDSTSVSPSSFGNSYELYAIAAAVLGGCSLRGGEGSILGVVIGTAVMQVLNNLITLLKLPQQHETTIIGAVILIGVIADEIVRRSAARRRLKQSISG